MGLRLVAHYYDRVEALIVSGALDAAGVPNWVENYWQNAVQPFHEICFGGYRIMVCERDMSTALDVIGEARRKRSFEGERLVKHYHFGIMLALTALTFGILGLLFLYFPLVSYSWRDVNESDH